MTQPDTTLFRRSARKALCATAPAPPALIEALWKDADGLLERGRVIKKGDRTTIAAVHAPSADEFIIKRANLKGPLHTAAHLVLRSRAQWSWINAARVAQAGILTPAPVAMLEERVGPLRLRSFLITEFVSGTPLIDWVRERAGDPPSLQAIASACAQLWRALGEARLIHGDMKASNFIVDAQERIWLIDLDGLRMPRVPGLLARGRRQDRERFLRNWQDQREVQELFRSRIDTAAPPGG